MDPVLTLPLSAHGEAHPVPLGLRTAEGGVAATVTPKGPAGGHFETPPDRPVYLTSDGLTAFDQPPDESALPITAGSSWSVTVDASLEGAGDADVWLIFYSPDARLSHAVVRADGLNTVFVEIPEGATRLRIGLRVRGTGNVQINDLRIGPPLPAALAVADGHFVAIAEACRAPAPGGSELPTELPAELPTATYANGSAAQEPSRQLTVYLTVDTEDAYFERPRLMTGDGLGRDYGAYGILDRLDRHGLAATFFVNVYEAHRHGGAVEELVTEIAKRGHEVGLHTHPAADLELYNRPLFRLPRDEQHAVLAFGAQAIRDCSGRDVVSFRAGGYALNEDTFAALADVGLRIDSSCFFPSPNNHFERFTVNALRTHSGLVEVPVTCVLRADVAGNLEHRKFDWDWLSGGELDEVVDRLAGCGIEHAVFMMHSFSFIEKETRPPEQPPDPRALFRSPERFNRYVEIYGVREEAPALFDAFLARLAQDERVQIRTLEEAEESLRQAAATPSPDLVPIIRRR